MATTIDWTAEVLDQIETHWQERLRPRLEGLTDGEFFWEPVPGCWSVDRRGGSTGTDLVGLGRVPLGLRARHGAAAGDHHRVAPWAPDRKLRFHQRGLL